MAYRKIARKVLLKLNRLHNQKDFSLTSIAKAVEISSKDKVKIILRGQPDYNVSPSFKGAMLSQELTARMVGCPDPVKVYEHFIYFSQKLKPEERRFAVAHELGHVYLHHSQRNRPKNYAKIDLPNSVGAQNSSFYVIDFSEDDEREADMFAAILAEQRHPIVRSTKFVMPCARLLNKFKSKKFINSTLGDCIPKDVPCVGSCSLNTNCHSALHYEA